ncbi:hypothetical protein [Methylobacterium brachiatum]|uniref:hypothetical protein n=1 Tax=Methylobacterium brachiatum TaxID=269660 RepID=UPI00244C9385|nr:hypothetical protein [Methylobacterium brachiatum]MDH2313089.1 hypothetical protein [Methylobacterium brachiatum]
MTTLTPHRDSLLKGLDEVERQLGAASVTEVGRYEREMSIGIARAALLPIADMLDRELPFEAVQGSLESAVANLVISHCLNFEAGDARLAGGFAVRMLASVRDVVQARLQANRPSAHVMTPVSHPTATGRA